MKRLGYVQKLDKSAMPNVARNIEDSVAHPDFDPNREYSVPWQSGQVLIIYRADKAGKEGPANANELLEDKKLKGKVTFLTEMRDSVGSVLLADNIEPEKATKDQCLAAIDKLEKGAKDGQIRRFTGNEYTRDISKGDSYAILGRVRRRRAVDRPGDEGEVPLPRRRLHDLHGLHADPGRRAPRLHGREDDGFRIRPRDPGADHGLRELRAAGEGHEGGPQESDPEIASNQLIFPGLLSAHDLKTFSPEDEAEIDEPSSAP